MLYKNKKIIVGYNGISRIYAKTDREIISLESECYKKSRDVPAAFATYLVTHMLQIQLIYTWLEDKFYPDASLAERRSVAKRCGNGRSCTSAAVSFDTAYFHDANYSHL